MSMVVSETSSSLRETSMGPLMATSALVAPIVHSAEPSARLNGFEAILSESCMSVLPCHGGSAMPVVVDGKIVQYNNSVRDRRGQIGLPAPVTGVATRDIGVLHSKQVKGR